MACRLASALVAVCWAGAAAALTPTEELARDILAELVAFDTAPDGETGRTRAAAERLAEMLVRARFPAGDVQVLGLRPGDGNLVARYRSPVPRQRPVLLMAHLDAVPAAPFSWATNPLELVEKDGWYYGRGTRDLKGHAALLVANFIRLKAEGFEPDRDLILLLTADEETTGANIAWLLEEHRPLVDAAFALNTDAGFVDLGPDGRPEAVLLQTAEKIYATFVLEAAGAGGHSSMPTPDNAIYALARGLARLAGHRFPLVLDETTRAYFARWAPLAPPGLEAGARALAEGRTADPAVASIESSPYLNAVLRTTCVPTRLRAGVAENVLADRALATVNCRILPGSSAGEVQAVLQDVVGPGLAVRPAAPVVAGPASPLDPAVLGSIEALAAEFWPGIPVLPELSPGATDGLFTRSAGIPTYGFSGVAEDPDDDRSHAPNERIRIAAFHESLEFWYRLLRRLAE